MKTHLLSALLPLIVSLPASAEPRPRFTENLLRYGANWRGYASCLEQHPATARANLKKLGLENTVLVSTRWENQAWIGFRDFVCEISVVSRLPQAVLVDHHEFVDLTRAEAQAKIQEFESNHDTILGVYNCRADTGLCRASIVTVHRN